MKRYLFLLVFITKILFSQNINYDPIQIKQFDHKIRLGISPGIASVKPAFLDESATSWVYNAFFNSLLGSKNPLVYSPFKPKAARMQTFDWEVHYTYKYKLEISYVKYQTLFSADRGTAATAIFYTPGNNDYNWSLFEGARLLKYYNRVDNIKISYLFILPKWKWIKVGPTLIYEKYHEKNVVSIGSYTLRRQTATINPTLRTWNAGGESSILYNLKGIYPGITSRFFLYKWLHINFNLYYLNRTGNFSFNGVQILQKTKDNEANFKELTFMVPNYNGDPKDIGIRTNIEGEFKICRFSFILGYVREDYKRKYLSYFGTTFGNTEDVILKTPNWGFGEIANQHKASRDQIYFKFNMAFYL
ncbi:MAG: hypothetical protein KatS3mg129_2169 [Leptospiraceae bacterium]|nr:MAG: hypothetical protein KatS3mg129_2169 [Leptospiraceae bacterium]